MAAKMDLAKDLFAQLRLNGLKTLSWAGDGGIFWIQCTRPADFDAIIDSAELAFRTLNKINGLYADRFPDGRQLVLRASGHFGPVFTVQDTRFWHGKELNFFAKNERLLTEPGMFGITEDLRDMLSQPQREKFTGHVAKTIDGRSLMIHFHGRFGEPESLEDFCANLAIRKPPTPVPSSLKQIGNRGSA